MLEKTLFILNDKNKILNGYILYYKLFVVAGNFKRGLQNLTSINLLYINF